VGAFDEKKGREEGHKEERGREMIVNWDAVSAGANWVSALIAGGALYLAYRIYKNSPKIVEQVGQTLEDQKKLAEAVAQADKDQGNRDVILEHNVNDLTRIRNRATIDRDGRILKLYAHGGPWVVGQKLAPGDYKEIDQS
jgi:hypothetical protein